jgi:hypothetical protein
LYATTRQINDKPFQVPDPNPLVLPLGQVVQVRNTAPL